jgi:hypothetical protein
MNIWSDSFICPCCGQRGTEQFCDVCVWWTGPRYDAHLREHLVVPCPYRRKAATILGAPHEPRHRQPRWWNTLPWQRAPRPMITDHSFINVDWMRGCGWQENPSVDPEGICGKKVTRHEF